jgi:CxxC motif-containing protein (DUF1111 family)
MNILKKKRIAVSASIIALVLLISACHEPKDWEDQANYDEWFSGGKQTVFDQGVSAFTHGFPVMDGRNSFVHEVGDLAFEATFVSGGNVQPGLGPVYNSVSCISCHIADGRGTPIGPGTEMVSLLIRMSIPGEDEHGGPLGVPGFGGQLQQNAIFGSQREAAVSILYSEIQGFYADGSTYQLRVPTYDIHDSYMPLPAGVMYSPRIAPPVFGLGLLEGISESDILALADPADANGDGISGKANYAFDISKQRMTLGRFGWKAAAPSVLQQTAGAYHQDMGITSYLFPNESSAGQANNNDVVAEKEVSDSLLEAVAHYVRTLAVPARRGINDPLVIQGKQLFASIGCASCHTPSHTTATNVAFSEISNQRIFPYTDMLLHDMGEGLADHRPDNLADGFEWRTAPLWGIGLTAVVNGHNNYLHDGRARSFEEAILWHGGEGEASKNAFVNLNAEDREALVAFLFSL